MLKRPKKTDGRGYSSIPPIVHLIHQENLRSSSCMPID